jgi:hypothetical protein
MAFARAAAASKSVKSLVLVSRSGRLDPTIAREMESHGCEVGLQIETRVDSAWSHSFSA